MDPIYELLGKIVAYGGGAVAIAYAAFVFFGKKWLDAKFDERLASFRHEQSKELEQLRFRINAQFNRVSKIHEKEIEVLPQAWTKMMAALGAVRFFASPMREYQDLDRLTPAQFEAFLDGSTLADWEKAEIRVAPSKLKYYQDRRFYHELRDARNAFYEFHGYITTNSIFLSQDIKTKFLKIDDELWSAIIETETGHEARDFKMKNSSFSKLRKDVEPIKDELEALVQKRLQLDQAE